MELPSGRKRTALARQWTRILSQRNDLIGGRLEYDDGQYAYSAPISSISISNNVLIITVEWCARTEINEDGMRIGQPWHACPCNMLSIRLVPLTRDKNEKGYMSYTQVDSDGCIYFDTEGSVSAGSWSIAPKNLVCMPSPEDVIGLNV